MTYQESSEGKPWLLLAQILRPQGRKGEVLADLFTDFPERFRTDQRVFLAPPGFAGEPSLARSVQVAGFFLPVGRNLGRIVLSLEGITSIEAAEALAGLEIIVPHEERLQPDEDSRYISDLLGCTVFNVPANCPPDEAPHSSTLIGVVDDVHFPTSPDGLRRLQDAAPLLAVHSPDGEEILIPFVKQFLVTIDLESHRILMTLPDGLLEVNTPPRNPNRRKPGSDDKI